MQTLLSLPRVVSSHRTAGSTFGRALKYSRIVGFGACLLAGIGSAAAQTIGVTATFTGAQPSSVAGAPAQVHPLAVLATSSQTAVVFGTFPLGPSSSGQ